jgi:hypothetical protein
MRRLAFGLSRLPAALETLSPLAGHFSLQAPKEK